MTPHDLAMIAALVLLPTCARAPTSPTPMAAAMPVVATAAPVASAAAPVPPVVPSRAREGRFTPPAPPPVGAPWILARPRRVAPAAAPTLHVWAESENSLDGQLRICSLAGARLMCGARELYRVGSTEVAAAPEIGAGLRAEWSLEHVIDVYGEWPSVVWLAQFHVDCLNSLYRWDGATWIEVANEVWFLPDQPIVAAYQGGLLGAPPQRDDFMALEIDADRVPVSTVPWFGGDVQPDLLLSTAGGALFALGRLGDNQSVLEWWEPGEKTGRHAVIPGCTAYRLWARTAADVVVFGDDEATEGGQPCAVHFDGEQLRPLELPTMPGGSVRSYAREGGAAEWITMWDGRDRGGLFRRTAGGHWEEIRVPQGSKLRSSLAVLPATVQAFGVGDVWVGTQSAFVQEQPTRHLLLSTKRPKGTLRLPDNPVYPG